MDINYELYKVFYFVAINRSFSAASEQLFVSQSAVSQAVKTLEEKTGCRLFIRNTKQVQLTREGEILFRHVEQAFNFLQAGERSLAEVRSLQAGEIRIGASDTICKHYLLPYFKKFNEDFPKIQIKVTNRTSPQCIDLLKKGLLDVIVINIPDKPDPALIVQKLKEIRDCFIAGQNFADLAGKTIPLRNLETLPVLMLEKNTVTRDFADKFLKEKGVLINPEIELGSLDLLTELAKIGLGISWVTRDFIAEELSKGEIFEVLTEEALPPRSLGFATMRNMPVPMAAQRFIRLLSEEMPPSGLPKAEKHLGSS